MKKTYRVCYRATEEQVSFTRSLLQQVIKKSERRVALSALHRYVLYLLIHDNKLRSRIIKEITKAVKEEL